MYYCQWQTLDQTSDVGVQIILKECEELAVMLLLLLLLLLLVVRFVQSWPSRPFPFFFFFSFAAQPLCDRARFNGRSRRQRPCTSGMEELWRMLMACGRRGGRDGEKEVDGGGE